MLLEEEELFFARAFIHGRSHTCVLMGRAKWTSSIILKEEEDMKVKEEMLG